MTANDWPIDGPAGVESAFGGLDGLWAENYSKPADKDEGHTLG